MVRSVQDVEVDGGEESLPVRADEGFGEESQVEDRGLSD